jgi:hypothetical protein
MYGEHCDSQGVAVHNPITLLLYNMSMFYSYDSSVTHDQYVTMSNTVLVKHYEYRLAEQFVLFFL